MMRVVNSVAIMVTLALAFALYHIKYETQAEQHDIGVEADDVAAPDSGIHAVVGATAVEEIGRVLAGVPGDVGGLALDADGRVIFLLDAEFDGA